MEAPSFLTMRNKQKETVNMYSISTAKKTMFFIGLQNDICLLIPSHLLDLCNQMFVHWKSPQIPH